MSNTSMSVLQTRLEHLLHRLRVKLVEQLQIIKKRANLVLFSISLMSLCNLRTQKLKICSNKAFKKCAQDKFYSLKLMLFQKKNPKSNTKVAAKKRLSLLIIYGQMCS